MACRHSLCVLPTLRIPCVFLGRRPHSAFATVLRTRREEPSEQREYTRRGNSQVPIAAQGVPPQSRQLVEARAAVPFRRAIGPAVVSETPPRSHNSRKICSVRNG